MTEQTKTVEMQEGPAETLRFFADLMESEQGKVNVILLPEGLRALADEIEELLKDEISLVDSNGQEFASIKGEEATMIIKIAVEKYIKDALTRSLIEYENLYAEREQN